MEFIKPWNVEGALVRPKVIWNWLLVNVVLVSFLDCFDLLIHKEFIHEHVIVNSSNLVKFSVLHELKSMNLNGWKKTYKNTASTNNRVEYTIFCWRSSPLLGYISLVQLHSVILCISFNSDQIVVRCIQFSWNLFQWV